tara:strand:+ start:556 stop:1320 length:765 start_codon:yes stop_codon:yes gene_type:complete
MKSYPIIIADKNKRSLIIKKKIKNNLLNNLKLKNSNLVIVIGGDGFMLKTLKASKDSKRHFYGINSGSYGFLMNKFSIKSLKDLNNTKKITISPLEMKVVTNQRIKKCLAINEVSILRQSRQTANLSIKFNSNYVIKKLVSDGVLVSTPAGSTAYNFSVNGPILSLDSKKISIAPISAFRPRRWKGKIINDNSKITIFNLDHKKRPISAVADNVEIRNAKKIFIQMKKKQKINLLYDKKRSLQKKNFLELLRRS